jgi:hypothetical protein
MSKHARAGRHTEALTDEVIDVFGIAGPPGYVLEKLQSMEDAGVTKFWLFEPNQFGVDPELLADCHRQLVDEVLPRL